MAKSLLFRWRKEAGLTGKRRQTDDPRGSRCVAGFVPVPRAAITMSSGARKVGLRSAGNSTRIVLAESTPLNGSTFAI